MSNQYNRGLSYLIILSLPIMAALWTKPFLVNNGSLKAVAVRLTAFAIFIIVLLFPAGLTESRSAKLALILALLTIMATQQMPRLTLWGLRALVFMLLAWPIVVQKGFLLFHDRLAHLPDSWRARVEIWDYLSYRILEHPWLGWGLGSSKFMDFKNPHGDLYEFAVKAAPHPHNVVTQLWVELGLPGLGLGIMFALLTLRKASHLSEPLVPFAMVPGWQLFALVAFPTIFGPIPCLLLLPLPALPSGCWKGS